MPAPVANLNAQKHGLYAFLALGSLPKGASYIRRQGGRLRVQLTQAVLESGRKVGVTAAATINSACRHEGRAMLLQRYLRLEADLPLAARIQLLREIGMATDSRDRCIRSLRLDVESPAPWDSLLSDPMGQLGLTGVDVDDAGDGPVGAQDGDVGR